MQPSSLPMAVAIADLPAPVAAFALRAIGSVPTPLRIHLQQRGTMCLRPGGAWRPFTAEQTIEVARVGFSWRARMKVLPGVSVHAIDEYAEGIGRLHVSLWGKLRLARDEGPAMAQGEALRYLAELPWCPHAITSNPDLQWRSLGPHRVEVATRVGGERVALQLVFDAAGDIVAAEAPARGYTEGRTTTARPWGGVFSAYRTLGGLRVPTRAEVSWELPDGPYTYFRGEIVQIDRS